MNAAFCHNTCGTGSLEQTSYCPCRKAHYQYSTPLVSSSWRCQQETTSVYKTRFSVGGCLPFKIYEMTAANRGDVLKLALRWINKPSENVKLISVGVVHSLQLMNVTGKQILPNYDTKFTLNLTTDYKTTDWSHETHKDNIIFNDDMQKILDLKIKPSIDNFMLCFFLAIVFSRSSIDLR